MNTLPATTEQIANLKAFAAAARSRVFEGTALKFVKGAWLSGKDELNMTGHKLVAIADRVSSGWTCWRDKKPIDARVGFVAEGFVPPRRSDLPDRDESQWEKDKQGHPKDPWQFGISMQLLDGDEARLLDKLSRRQRRGGESGGRALRAPRETRRQCSTHRRTSQPLLPAPGLWESERAAVRYPFVGIRRQRERRRIAA